VALSALLLAPALHAQPSASPSAPAAVSVPELDTAQLVAQVLQHNPGLQAAAQSLAGARAAVTSAGALPNPRLEWSRGPWQSLDTANALNQRGQTWSLAQPIENPWLRSARIDASQAGQRSAEQQLAMVRNDLIAQLRLRIHEAMLFQAETEAAAESLGLLEQVRQRVRVRVDSGEAARYELIKADAEVINARERKQSAALKAEQSLLEINRLAAGQLPAQWRLKPGTGTEGQEPLTLAALQPLAREANPELQGLRHDLERARSRLQAARASILPSVDLRYTEMKDPQVKQSQWGVSVQLPLLDQRRGPVAEAEAELERSRVLYEGRQAVLEQQVLLAWRALEMARLRVEALSQGVLREAEAALRVAEAAYRFGERGILDVLDAQRVLRTVRADLLQARYQQQAARITLEQLSGRYAAAPSSTAP
jgi:cobalt-zinc-cadmium efflux system outer membrane protein